MAELDNEQKQQIKDEVILALKGDSVDIGSLPTAASTTGLASLPAVRNDGELVSVPLSLLAGTVSGDVEDRISAIEESIGASGGIAPLDDSGRLPYAMMSRRPVTPLPFAGIMTTAPRTNNTLSSNTSTDEGCTIRLMNDGYFRIFKEIGGVLFCSAMFADADDYGEFVQRKGVKPQVGSLYIDSTTNILYIGTEDSIVPLSGNDGRVNDILTYIATLGNADTAMTSQIKATSFINANEMLGFSGAMTLGSMLERLIAADGAKVERFIPGCIVHLKTPQGWKLYRYIGTDYESLGDESLWPEVITSVSSGGASEDLTAAIDTISGNVSRLRTRMTNAEATLSQQSTKVEQLMTAQNFQTSRISTLSDEVGRQGSVIDIVSNEMDSVTSRMSFMEGDIQEIRRIRDAGVDDWVIRSIRPFSGFLTITDVEQSGASASLAGRVIYNPTTRRFLFEAEPPSPLMAPTVYPMWEDSVSWGLTSDAYGVIPIEGRFYTDTLAGGLYYWNGEDLVLITGAAINADNDERITAQSRIEVMAEGMSLRIYGHKKFLEAGYTPYVFRHIRTSSHYHSGSDSDHSPALRGWRRYGSHHTIRIKDNGIVEFSTNDAEVIDSRAVGYSSDAEALPRFNEDNSKVLWGCKGISLYAPSGMQRMLRLPYAIGFAKMPEVPGGTKVSTLHLVSNLATFSVRWDPKNQSFHFSR